MLREIFDALDKDHSGLCDKNEFKKLFTLDDNLSNIDEEAFAAMFHGPKQHRKPRRRQPRSKGGKRGKGGKGGKRVGGAGAGAGASAGGGRSSPDATVMLNTSLDALLEETIDAFFSVFDEDGDEVFDFEEFCSLVRTLAEEEGGVLKDWLRAHVQTLRLATCDHVFGHRHTGAFPYNP